MSSPIEGAERLAADLGHEVTWDIAGEHMAHGHCTRFGASVHVVQSEHEGDTLRGEALAIPCTDEPAGRRASGASA